MKISVMLSVALGALTFIGQAHAINVPDQSVGLDECLSWANAQGSVSSAATKRCYGLHDCNRNQSEVLETLRECLANVEADFQAATGGAQPQVGDQTIGTKSEVTTDVADSYYEQKGSDHKGWEESDLGK